MKFRIIRRVLVAIAAAALPLGALGVAPQAHAGSPIGFAHTVLVDPQRLGTEPTLEVDSKGNIYISSIIGFSNHTSFLWKSEDGGESWDALRLDIPTIQRPDKTVGGGDTALIVSPPVEGSHDDTVTYIDLEGLATFGSGTSFDGGNSFTNENVFASGSEPLADRQWGGWWRDPQGTIHLYNFYNALADGFTIIETTDYGKNWVDWKRPITNAGGRPGPLFVDPKTGDLLATWTANGGAGITVCHQDKSCSDTIIATQKGGNSNNTFAAGAMDRQGNLYVTWSTLPADPSKTPTLVYLATSTDKGKHWSKPVVVSGDYPDASMPAIVAGDAGRVDVVYYASSKLADPNVDNDGPWYPVMSQSLNALAAKPTWTTTRVSEHPNHMQPICTNGIGCSADPNEMDDRNLGDFFSVRLGKRGEALVTWVDNAHQVGATSTSGRVAFNEFTKQTTGPSLYTNVGDLAAPSATSLAYSGRSALAPGDVVPRNWTVDEVGDARVPRHGISGPAPHNFGSLDVEQSWIEPAATDAMRVTMKIHDLADFQVPSVNEHDFYMTWWWSNNQVHYAAADLDATGTADCFAGEPNYSNPASPRWGLYPRLSVPPPSVSTTTCTIDKDKGTITLDVPYSAVNASAGDTLYSVHSSTYHYQPPAYGLNVSGNVMEEVDQTAPFSYVVGTPKIFTSVAGRQLKRSSGGTTHPSGGPLPATGTDGEWLGIGVALVAVASAGARRLRRAT